MDSWAGYSGGTGEPNDPFRISKVADWQELMTSEAHWDQHFILTTELDLTGVTVTPVGHETQNFTGSIDGSGYVIRDITIAMPDSDCVALFGSVGSGARIHHVGLEDVEVAGHGYVATLAGDNDGAISNCYSTGRVTGAYNVGGLVGYNINGRINNCYSTGSVTGDNGVGGLVGYNYGGRIHNCYANNRVTGSGGRVGGLAGHYYYGAITRSYFLRLDDGGGPDNGLGTALTDIQMRQQGSFIGWDFVGETSNGTCDFWQMANGEGYPVLSTLNGRIPAEPVGSGTVENPYILTDANELGTVWYRPSEHYVLGNDVDLVGTKWTGPPVPFFRGVFDGNGHLLRNVDVNTPSDQYVGLFGCLTTGQIKNLGVEDVSILGNKFVGGLVGYNYGGSIHNCDSTGWVNATGRCVGGVVGENSAYSIVSNCRSTCLVNGGSQVGGLAGGNEGGAIVNCSATGSAAGTYSDVGGLVGLNSLDGSIINCYSSGPVTGGWGVGGLLGVNYGGAVNSCYSTARVASSRIVGGLVGWNESSAINNCYSTGSVTGESDVAGFVGGNWKAYIVNCYSTGLVTVTSDDDVGGFVGGGYYGTGDTVGSSFWDVNTSTWVTSAAGEPKTTSEMKTQSTFIDAGWDFVGEEANGTEDIWFINEGVDYPRLWWEDCSVELGLEFGDFRTVERTRVGRSVFRYVLSVGLTNTTGDDLTDVQLALFSSSPQVTAIIDGHMVLPIIEAHTTIDTFFFDEYFIVEVDRYVNIVPGSFGWQVPCIGVDGCTYKVLMTCIPSVETEITDLVQLSESWLWTGPPGGIADDVVPDGRINFADFATLCQNWLSMR